MHLIAQSLADVVSRRPIIFLGRGGGRTAIRFRSGAVRKSSLVCAVSGRFLHGAAGGGGVDRRMICTFSVRPIRGRRETRRRGGGGSRVVGSFSRLSGTFFVINGTLSTNQSGAKLDRDHQSAKLRVVLARCPQGVPPVARDREGENANFFLCTHFLIPEREMPDGSLGGRRSGALRKNRAFRAAPIGSYVKYLSYL